VKDGTCLKIAVSERRDDDSIVNVRGVLQDIANVPIGSSKNKNHFHVLDGAPPSLVAVLSSPVSYELSMVDSYIEQKEKIQSLDELDPSF